MLLRYINRNFTGETVFLFKLIFNAIGDRIFFLFPNFFLGLFGDEFKTGVTAFIFLSCGRLISSFSGSVGNLLQMTGNQNVYGTILFLAAILIFHFKKNRKHAIRQK